MDIKKLELKLNIIFLEPKLLAQAMTHRSWLNESANRTLVSNERLEFLGDAVLGFLVSEWLYQEFPNFPEGNLTNLRSALVKTQTLAQIAKNLGVGNFLLLSKGESDSGGQKNPALLANCFEAIIGAIFLDQGLDKTRVFLRTQLEPEMAKIVQKGEFKDFKSLLQERLQAKFKLAPAYKTVKEEGPDHQKIFTIGVYHQGKLITTGDGKSKQEAEEKAARLAIDKLGLKR